MKRNGWLLLSLLLLLVTAALKVQAADWVQDGGSLNQNPNHPTQKSSVTVVNGQPYVAFMEQGDVTSVYSIFVKHFSGGNWILDGTGPVNISVSQSAEEPSIAAYNNTIYVAWRESSPTRIHVAHLSGSTWVPDGTVVNWLNTQNAYAPKLGFTSTGIPYVASYEQFTPKKQVRLKHLSADWVQDPGSFESLNNSNSSDAQNPSMLLAGENLYIAWDEGSPNQIYVKQLYSNGYTFNQLGIGSQNVNNTYDAVHPYLAYYNNKPLITWVEGTNTIYTKQYINNNWAQVGTGIASGQIGNFGSDLAMSAGGSGVYIFYCNKQWGFKLNCMQLTNSGWQQFGGILNINGDGSIASCPSAVTTSDKVYVAWTEDGKLYVKHYAPPLIPSQSSLQIKTTNNQINPLKSEKANIFWTQPSSAKATVTIYNLLGDKVIQLANVDYTGMQLNKLTWDGKNQWGSVVSSGIYVVDIKAGGNEGYSKIAVVK